MKHIGWLSIYFSLLFVFLLVNRNQTFGQDKFNISGGFGFPDLVNIGARYQVKQDTLQLGISIGIGQEIQAISGDVFYHFGGYSKLSNRHPWRIFSLTKEELIRPSSRVIWMDHIEHCVKHFFDRYESFYVYFVKK